MYEFEVNYTELQAQDTPKEVLDAFLGKQNFFQSADAISPLLWEEHCTECAMPSCFATCDLYEPRKDGKCRRFAHGISKIDLPGVLQKYIVKIEFKRWGVLLCESKIGVSDLKRVKQIEKKSERVENLARNIPDASISILGRRGLSSRLARRYKRKSVETLIQTQPQQKPSCFVAEIYNPEDSTADISLVIRSESGSKRAMPYQKRIKLHKGYRRVEISFNEIENHVDLSKSHFISITPNQVDNESSTMVLYFGFVGFIKNHELEDSSKIDTSPDPSHIEAKSAKVVVWDLDHTLWDGILVEHECKFSLQLKPGVAHTIKELDRRGIVNSIISKNDHDNAMGMLESLGIAEYFVFPEISWEPKSVGMTRVIDNFNVGSDAIVFIDDSAFEREEVSSKHPQIRTLDAIEYDKILDRPEFNPKVSTESSRRREFYQNQKKRVSANKEFSGDYLEFIRDCEIRLNIKHGKVEDIERIHELVQRTNQMNFSGNRYSKQELIEILNDPLYESYSLECQDKYGDYGTVGFCIVDTRKVQIIDLAFSCRVQSKRVEHAFICWLMRRFQLKGHTSFFASYKKTERNAQSGKVFDDLGFTEKSPGCFQFSLESSVVVEDLITITMKE
jgi:FkbH-like protein